MYIMKIAFISYEYPPDTAYGGIGTYMYQAAQMMHQMGHHVEVFTSSPHRSGTDIEDDILVHRINEKSRELFPAQIGKVFAKRHDIIEFDVLEGPEYKADAQAAVGLVPTIPLLIKLGRLIPPRSPQIIAQTVITLLKNPELRMKLGEAARNNVLTEYNTARIGALQEASYHRAIARRQAICARNISGFV
jgi:hypothetical protein